VEIYFFDSCFLTILLSRIRIEKKELRFEKEEEEEEKTRLNYESID
jgi:hypothetical protein